MNTNTAASGIENHAVVSTDRWLTERKTLLAREKALTRLADEVACARRALPWVRIEKNYVFDTLDGARTLAALFEGRRQLLVQHFMFGPGWEQGCPSCSFMADHIDGMNVHLAGTYAMLDLTAKGRDERNVPYKMEWVRHHDRYAPTPGAAVEQAGGACCEEHA